MKPKFQYWGRQWWNFSGWINWSTVVKLYHTYTCRFNVSPVAMVDGGENLPALKYIAKDFAQSWSLSPLLYAHVHSQLSYTSITNVIFWYFNTNHKSNGAIWFTFFDTWIICIVFFISWKTLLFSIRKLILNVNETVKSQTRILL